MQSQRYALVAAGVGLLLLVGIVVGLLNRNASLAPASLSGSDLNLTGAPAPEFTGIDAWLNGPSQTMKGLRGKVVLVDFWTYSCINCQRTFPFLRAWYSRYHDQGLEIVGVHSPEFQFEKNVDNVRQALTKYQITWPVAVDSEMATWNAWQNQYWPADYLVDRQGRLRHSHFGEGDYATTERDIQNLLNKPASQLPSALVSANPGISGASQGQTNELYAGRARGSLGNAGGYHDGTAGYSDPGGQHANNEIYLEGSWTVNDEYLQHAHAAAPGQEYALIDYRASNVYMVASGSGGRVWLSLDGHDLDPSMAGGAVHFVDGKAYVDIDHSDLYHLVVLPTFGEHVLRVSPEGADFRLFTFTFGS